MIYRNETFDVGDEVFLDGNEFYDCTFKKCLVVYNGGNYEMEKVTIDNVVTLKMGESALRTLRFLAELYESGFSEYVEQVFEAVRKNKLNPVDPYAIMVGDEPITIKMHVVVYEEGKEPKGSLRFQETGKLKGEGNITFVCGNCERVIAENMTKDNIATGMPIFCGACNVNNVIPPIF